MRIIHRDEVEAPFTDWLRQAYDYRARLQGWRRACQEPNSQTADCQAFDSQAKGQGQIEAPDSQPLARRRERSEPSLGPQPFARYASAASHHRPAVIPSRPCDLTIWQPGR